MAKDIYKGDNATHKFQLKVNNENYDLTSVKEITFYVKSFRNNTKTILITKTMTDSGIVRQSPYTDGKLYVYMIPEDTEEISIIYTNTNLWFSIQIIDADDNRKTFGRGEYTINEV